MELFKALRNKSEVSKELGEPGYEEEIRKLTDSYRGNEEGFQKEIAKVADEILMRELIPVWRNTWGREVNEQDLSPKDQARFKSLHAAEDTFTLILVRFIVYAVGQIRNMAWAITFSFIGLLIVSNSYDPSGPLLIARFLACGFIAVGFVIVWVFAKMERNRVLSLISRTSAGQLSREFWLQILSFGSLPLLGVIAHLFPQISQFLSSWVAPSVQGVH
jgi:hypothetical protein